MRFRSSNVGLTVGSRNAFGFGDKGASLLLLMGHVMGFGAITLNPKP